MSISKRLLFGLCACALLAGCGKQHKAEGVIGDYIKQNTALADYSLLFEPLDSTDRVTTERIANIRKAAAKDPLFKNSAAFPAAETKGKLIFTRTKIINGTDTAVRTFYLDSDITQVIAFKMN